MRTLRYDTDLCVVGGGIAGLCCALAAARHGIKTVLMQDRPVLGGNASSEIRMWIGGCHGKDNRESGIVEELFMENFYQNPGLKYTVWDSVLYEKAMAEENLTTSGNTGATLQVPQPGEGVTLQAATSANGANPTDYDSASHTSYKWLRSAYSVPRSYTVTFDAAGGSSVAAQTVSDGQNATKPADPVKAGYLFKGWTKSGASYDFNTPVSGDITLVATWAPVTYTVSFGANGGTGTMTAAETAAGEFTLPQNGFTAPAGKRFKAWSVSGSEKAVGSKITVSGNLTVTAVWENVPAGHTCKIEAVAKVDPTCTAPGKEAYYVCEGCGKFFSDAQGKNPIGDLNAWGNLEMLSHTESDWKSDEENHRKECTVCKAEIAGTKAAHIYEEGKCSVCGYEQGAATDPITPDVSVDSGSTDVSDAPGTNVGTDDSGTDAPSAETVPDTSAGNGNGEEKTGSLLWLWITLPVVLLLGAGAAVFFVLKKKSSAK